MRKSIKLTFLILVLLSLAAAIAEGDLSGTLDGNLLRITWRGVRGNCRLTVYREGWPVTALDVRGEDGGARLSPGDAPGEIALRLAAPGKTLTARVSSGKPSGTTSRSGTAAAGSTKPGMAAQIVAEVNREREKLGLSALREDAELNRAAAVRARELAVSFSHTRPDGTSWRTVSARALGENIARGHRTAEKTMAAWMSSGGHRANILRAGFGSIGVCAYIQGGVLYWVQLFGK